MASLAHDDVKHEDYGSNEVGDSVIDNVPGVMWSIGKNSYGQQGDGTTNDVKQLTLHQWAKDIDIVKVVSNGMISMTVCIDSVLIR